MSSPVDIDIQSLSTDAVKVRVNSATSGAILSRYDGENDELHTVIDKDQNISALTLAAELVTAPKTTPSAHSTTSNPSSGNFTPILNSDNYIVNTTNSLTLRKPVGGTHGETMHMTYKNTSASNITITIGTDYIVANAINTIVLATTQWVDIEIRFVIDTWMVVGRQTSVASTTNANPFTWRGAYASGTTYVPNDLVSYLGSSYINILQSTGNVPTNTTYWNLVAAAGSSGSTGATGPKGQSDITTYQFSTDTANSNPGFGKIKVNHASLVAATVIRVNVQDIYSGNFANYIQTWDDSTSTVKGFVILRNVADPALYATWRISAVAVVGPGTSYFNLTVVGVDGSVFADGDYITIGFYRTGDAGA